MSLINYFAIFVKQLRWNCFEIVNAHMKKTALLILLFAVCLDGMSKSMAEIWRTMPDTIIPYIDAKHRTEMIDFIGLGQIGEVDNVLQGKSSIVVVNANYLQAKLNEVTIVQLKRLSYIGGDSVFCMVKTWLTPEPESEVSFYTQDWQQLFIPSTNQGNQLFSVESVSINAQNQLSITAKDSLHSMTEFILTSASLSADNEQITISCSAPLTSTDNKDKVKDILRPVVLTWDGSTFK